LSDPIERKLSQFFGAIAQFPEFTLAAFAKFDKLVLGDAVFLDPRFHPIEYALCLKCYWGIPSIRT
jgi:hypothetical protein